MTVMRAHLEGQHMGQGRGAACLGSRDQVVGGLGFHLCVPTQVPMHAATHELGVPEYDYFIITASLGSK